MKKIKFPEHSSIEFKECRGKKSATLPDDLWESMAAFSNTHGGTIYLGVNDNGEILSLDNKDLDKLQKDLSTMMKGKFNIHPKVEVLCNCNYIQVQISELEAYNKPIYSKKAGPRKIYVRRGSTNVLASDEEMRSLFAGANGGGENQTVEGKLTDLIDEKKLDDYISRTGLKDLPFSGLESKLKKLKALKDAKLTIFGLVAFGKDYVIDDLLNNIYIDFKLFQELEKLARKALIRFIAIVRNFMVILRNSSLKPLNILRRSYQKKLSLTKIRDCARSNTFYRKKLYVKHWLTQSLIGTILFKVLVSTSICMPIV